MADFLHGVEVIEVNTGVRAIQTASSSVIGVVGTAPDATAFPLNEPVLITSYKEAAALGAAGSLLNAISGIYDQSNAVVVVVRVEEGETEAETLANVIGGVNAVTGNYEGVHALLGAQSIIGVAPRILIAPGFTHQSPEAAANPVVAELLGIAERLRAVIVQDGPNTTDAAAIAAAGHFGSARVYLVDPWVKVMNTDGNIIDEPASARVAGLIAKVDNERGFWWSPSNNTLNGIVGTSRPVDFKLGDATCRANLLNAANVTTIIRENGFRLWGNRSLSDDPKWAFLSVRRTADIINDSVMAGHMWAVDRNITRTYVDDVTGGVNAFIRSLISQGALLGGNCWADPDLNSPENITLGNVFFNFDFTPPYPAERITFRSHLVNNYLSEVLG